MRALAFLLLIAGAAGAARARDTIGIFRSWGAFREGSASCFAIAEPVDPPTGSMAFAAIGYWPGSGVRGQLHVRLSRAVRQGTRVTLTIGGYDTVLVGGGGDAWAPTRRADAEVVANMRIGSSMSIAGVAWNGAFADVYRLRGAASAIDAAALACLPSR